MPHVAFVPFTGFRVREEEMLALGMSLPGLRQRAAAIGQLPALGLLTLAGMLPEHWSCSYHEARQADEELLERVLAARPDLVAISALTASVEEAYRLSARLRQAGARVILGGLHATACPEEAVEHCDAVAVGDGESVWPCVLHDVEYDNLQRFYRAATPFDLAHAPLPRLDLLGLQPPRFTLQTQRGCPLACEFCGASRLLGPFREKPIERIAAELHAIVSRSPGPLLELADDNTFVRRQNVDAMLDLFARRQVRYFTEADWRMGEQTALLERLAASGCVQVLIGLESLIFRYPGMGAKQAEMARIITAIRAIQDAGVCAIGCFIVGCDGETPASMDRLARFIDDSPLADVQLTIQTPFPGTALHRRLQREGRLLPGRGWSHCTLFDVAFQPDRMSVIELETGFQALVRQVFGAAATARRACIRKQVWRNNPRLRACASAPSAAI